MANEDSHEVINSDKVGPTFIVGVPRSGTTLLVNLLGRHPLFAPLYETRFLRNLLVLCERLCWYYRDTLARRSGAFVAEPLIKAIIERERKKYRSKIIQYNPIVSSERLTRYTDAVYPFGNGQLIAYKIEDLVRETDRWFASIGNSRMSPELVYASAREYLDRLFAIHCARMKKPFWINKTPGLLTYLDRLPNLYPNIRCIHIIRDGRDVALSNLSRGWGGKTVGALAARWKRLIETGRRQVNEERMSYLELHYEDLIRAPRKELNRVFDFLGVRAVVDEILSGVTIMREREALWRNRLNQNDRETFARKAGDLLIGLDYERDSRWAE